MLRHGWLKRLAERFRSKNGARPQRRHRRLCFERLPDLTMLAGNLIDNGSFELDAVNDHNGTWQHYDAITSWVRESGNKIELEKGLFNGAAQGEIHLELDSDVRSSISQIVTAVAEQKYKLRFAFSGRPGVPTHDNVLDVQIINVASGANIDFTLVVAATGESVNGNQPQLSGDSNWKYYEAVFVAPAASLKVIFGDAGAESNSYGTFLDDVSLTETTETPPPPNLIRNGSFEQHIVGDNGRTWQLYARLPGDDAQHEIPHWNLETGNFIELHRGILGGPAEGYQHAELDSDGRSGISQTVSTVAEQAYKLRFAFSGRSGLPTIENVVDVQIMYLLNC